MNAFVGSYSLMAALLVSALTVVAGLGAVRFGTGGWFRATRWGFALMVGLLLTASAALISALATNDFTIEYVASYTERALPIGYKLSAFWAGQEGSLLFWAVTLAVMAILFVIGQRKVQTRAHAWSLLTLALVCGFFVAMLLLAGDSANPFTLSPVVPADGRGLNPMLQNIGMIAHPPTLFIGYAGFTIPFALIMGALLAGKIDNTWIIAARRWALVSWLFLTVGIVLGAQWAYVELGWGGYWAWDPVENASLLPWLTGTALLHAMLVQKDRSMFKVWSASMAILTFILCIFGTYITRSGAIQSVHAFAPSLIASFFLTFLIVTTAVSLVFLILRGLASRDGFEPSPSFEAFVSKDVAVLVGNCMLVIMMVLTLFMTVFPLLSGGGTFQPAHYNKIVLPLAIVMFLMMGAAPMLSYGASGKLRDAMRRLRIPLVIAAVCTVAVLLRVGWSLWTASATFAIALTVSGIITDYISVVGSRRRNANEGFATAALAALDANHRRYGGHLAHIGMAMIVAGVVGSSLYATKASLTMTRGQTQKVGHYSVKFDGLENARGSNFQGVEAVIQVTDASGKTSEMRPQLRQYTKWEQTNAEVAFLTGLREDVYVTLLGVEPPNDAAVQVVINPLVLWIWLGGIAMTLGALWCMLPTFSRKRQPELLETQSREEVLA